MKEFALWITLGCCCAVFGCGGRGGGEVESRDILSRTRDRLDQYTPTEAARHRVAGLEIGHTIPLVMELNGRRVGTGSRVTKPTTYRRQDALATDMMQEMSEFYQGVRLNTRIRWSVITDPDTGRALYSSKRTEAGENVQTETASIVGDRAIFEAKGAEGHEERSISVPQDIRFSFSVDLRWLATQNPAVGKSFTSPVLDMSGQRVIRETVEIRAQREETIGEATLNVWEAEIRPENGQPIRVFFTSAGEMVRQRADTPQGSYEIRVASAHEAARDPARLARNTTVPISFSLPAWDRFDTLLYRAEPAERWTEHLRETPYARLSQTTEGLEVTLQKHSPRAPDVTLPMRVPDPVRQEFLLPTSDAIQPEVRAVRRMAQRIADKEKRVVHVVARLAGWIYQEIEYSAIAKPESTPTRTLEERSGTALEQANLFASFARALGIPTRHCAGLLIQKDAAIYHTWVEVWVQEQWLPVDPSVNRVGLPAGYLLLSHGRGQGNPDNQFQWVIQRGGIGLRLVSASRQIRLAEGVRTFTLQPDQPRSFVAMNQEETWLANLYWGVSVSRPAAWNADVTSNSITLTSPDRQATIVIEALDHLMDADQTRLDATVLDLQRSLEGFESVNRGIVPFGPRQNTRSIFVDFRCTQNGARRRAQMYIIPRRDRTYRVSAWGPAQDFPQRLVTFKTILDTIDL